MSQRKYLGQTVQIFQLRLVSFVTENGEHASLKLSAEQFEQNIATVIAVRSFVFPILLQKCVITIG